MLVFDFFSFHTQQNVAASINVDNERRRRLTKQTAGRHGARRHTEQITILQNVVVLVDLVGESRSPKFTVSRFCCDIYDCLDQSLYLTANSYLIFKKIRVMERQMDAAPSAGVTCRKTRPLLHHASQLSPMRKKASQWK